MCIYNRNKPTLKIAEEDIICYKLVNIYYKPISWFTRIFRKKPKLAYFSSFARGYKYKLGKLEVTNLEEFHTVFKCCFASGGGFYSYDMAIFGNVKCIIPKGAKYYAVIDDDSNRLIYISEAIKIIGILDND